MQFIIIDLEVSCLKSLRYKPDQQWKREGMQEDKKEKGRKDKEHFLCAKCINTTCRKRIK